ncbi:MAG TPA: hypothetical protein VHR66_24805 [Gemmataceae bacterium]|nr:hypothetical protein [Gemmataceae bacterium]
MNFQVAAGHEHRVEAITRRALDLTAERLPMHLTDTGDLESLAVAPIQLRLGAMSNEEAADQMAAAILEALALQLKA